MCVVACKYFPNFGWVGVKNRDRLYKPEVILRKSFRDNVERCYMWDNVTHYSEGLNEFGVAIISAAVQVKDDEAEGKKQRTEKQKIKPRTFYSPDGKRIRKALFEKTVKDALLKLIELEIPGNTLVFDKDLCYILEGSYSEDDLYIYKTKEIRKDEVVVRTNHGILLPWTGYNADIPEQKDARLSSDIRYKKAKDAVEGALNPKDMLAGLSDTSDENPQHNVLRNDINRNAMKTTGQLMLVPGHKTLHYKPVWCSLEFRIDKLLNQKEKTFFEVISTRKLISFNEHFNKG